MGRMPDPPTRPRGEWEPPVRFPPDVETRRLEERGRIPPPFDERRYKAGMGCLCLLILGLMVSLLLTFIWGLTR